MCNNRWGDPHIAADDNGAGARIDDHLGGRTRRIDLDIFKKADKGDFLRRIDRSPDLDGRSVKRHSHLWSEHLIHRIGNPHGGAEIRLVEVQQNIVGRLERRIDHLFNGGAARDPANSRDVHNHRRSVISGHTKTTDNQIALGDGVGFAVSTKHRCHQQRATTERFRPADGRDGHIKPLAGLHESRHLSGDHDRRHILCIQIGGIGDQAKLRDHGLQRLQRQA